MTKPVLIYCYDAYCGWCYGFSPVIKKLFENYQDRFEFEVLSGGMIQGDPPKPIASMAKYILGAYKTVESYTGITFGEDFLWHIRHAEESDWFLDSEKPAIALCVFKDYFPEKQVLFAADLQYALNYEGRDLCDDEAYRHLLEKYQLPATEFYTKLHSEEYKDKAHHEFSLCKQLQVTGFPAVLVQTTESKFYLISRGFSTYDTMQERLEKVLTDITVSRQDIKA